MGVNNFLLHSDIKNDDAKQRKIATEYVALCGFKNGDNQFKRVCDNRTPLTQQEIASQLGVSERTLKNRECKGEGENG